MKKILFVLLFSVFFIPFVSSAQTTTEPFSVSIESSAPVEMTHDEYISFLKNKINELLKQYIAILTAQLNAQLAIVNQQTQVIQQQQNVQASSIAQIQNTQQVQQQQIQSIVTQQPATNTSIVEISEPTVVVNSGCLTLQNQKAPIYTSIYGDWSTGEFRLYGGVWDGITSIFKKDSNSNPMSLQDAPLGNYKVTAKINYGSNKISNKEFTIEVKNCQ